MVIGDWMDGKEELGEGGDEGCDDKIEVVVLVLVPQVFVPVPVRVLLLFSSFSSS